MSTNSAFAQSIRSSECVTFDSATETIIVSCENATLPQARTLLSDDSVLTEESNGIWLLKANLFIDKDSTFVISANDTQWLKITAPFGIKSLGNLIINSVKITSWDDKTQNYILANGNVPRPYLTEDNEAIGQMNISNSEIAYLGYNHSDRQGIAYLGGDGSIVSNNDIHHMWYGFYSSERANMTVIGNHVHDNEIYGIDPHTFTNHMTIRNNTVHDIRNGIGIICSDQCSHILIEDNIVYNTNGPGIMLDLGTTNSTVRNNAEYGSLGAGLSIHDNSARNNAYNNTLRDNLYGIKMSLNSTDNRVFANRITNSSDYGLCIMENSTLNEVKSNLINISKNYGICVITGATKNIVESNVVSNSFLCGVLVSDYRRNLVRNNTLVSSDECAPIIPHDYF